MDFYDNSDDEALLFTAAIIDVARAILIYLIQGYFHTYDKISSVPI